MVIWFIGLSGSGKTTLASKLFKETKKIHTNTVFLDGDILRDVWADDLSYTIEGRERNAKRISNLCKLLDQQGFHVIASVLSIFPEWQQWNREKFSSYFEIFLDVPMEVLIERDTKNLYKQALAGEIENVVGVQIPFPRPSNPDLVLSETNETPEDTIKNVLEILPKFL